MGILTDRDETGCGRSYPQPRAIMEEKPDTDVLGLLDDIKQLVGQISNKVSRLVRDCADEDPDENVRHINQSAEEWIQQTLEDVIATSSGIMINTLEHKASTKAIMGSS
ncbi:hypothetical protein IWX65_003375 [Arthrobacter sp. CAN_A214]|uniref:hypothetical protein n=1 Tax=Arthrobacter sp. CAN_A214 TaxID=2787720 RepID=UPI0018C925C9